MALSADRNTPRLEGDILSFGVVAGALVYAGALVMLNVSGYVTKGQAATGLFGVGRAEERATGGAADGDVTMRVRAGTFRFANSAAGDQITIADRGKVCYAVDDQTVAKTSNSGARSPAGFVADVDAQGVWVEFDLAKMGAWLAAREEEVNVRVATLVGNGVYRAISPVSGRLKKISSITEGVLTTGDATLTAKINGVAVTNGVITITQAGSAAGDKDSATPTAANYVAEGDELSLTVGGTNATATVANGVFEIERD